MSSSRASLLRVRRKRNDGVFLHSNVYFCRWQPAGDGQDPRARRRPTRAEAAELDGRLRKAAVETFLEHGFHGTTMDAVARAAGITRRTLYARYPDKGALFAEVIPWALGTQSCR